VSARESGGPCVGQTLDPPVIFREPDGLFIEDGRHRNPGTSGPVNRPLPLPRPGRSAQMRPQAGSMIADAVRYMSVHSWKQPDSHGHSGTSQPKKQQPARRGIPSSRAVSAGSGRCWVRTSVGLADGFTDRLSLAIGMAADLLKLPDGSCEKRALSAICPRRQRRETADTTDRHGQRPYKPPDLQFYSDGPANPHLNRRTPASPRSQAFLKQGAPRPAASLRAGRGPRLPGTCGDPRVCGWRPACRLAPTW